MASEVTAALSAGVPRNVSRRLRAQVREMAALMEQAILDEVPRYHADPDRYGQEIVQLCRLAVLIFLRILERGKPSSRLEVAAVMRIGASVARADEPLEPLLHALRIGARVGWAETLAASLSEAGVEPEQMLSVAGQVFEYIDQLSSRIAEAYAAQIEENVRARALTESAMFEDLVAGRAGLELGRPRVALAVAASGRDRGAAQSTADAVAGRLRMRLPNAVIGQRNGLQVLLLSREPLASLLGDCAQREDVRFGLSRADEDVPLSRAVDEAVEAAYLALETRTDTGAVIEFAAVHTYAALRSDPGGLARSQRALLGPLLDRPVLLETLRAYVDAGRSVSATAQRVHRHRQSVIYRLQRISELLGTRLDDAEAMFRVEAAVRTLPA